MSDAVLLGLIALASTTVVAIANLIIGIRTSRKTDEIQHTTNGMSKRLEEAEYAKGVKAGKDKK